MIYTRITAHFNTTEDAKRAFRFIKKHKNWGHYTGLSIKIKKISIEKDLEESHSLKSEKANELATSRDNVLCWLDKCKGLSYTILVSR